MEDRYLTYTAVELAQEDAFIRWVKEENEALAKGWEAWLKAHPEKRDTVEEARRIVRALRVEEQPISTERINQLWDKIDAQTAEEQAPDTGRRVALRWISYAAAAILAFLLAFFFLYPQNSTTEVVAERGQLISHALPDGSAVALNAGSSIRYQPESWKEARQVQLEGEAFFEVEKGVPFTVKTPLGQVRVLGTSFNINTYEGRFSIRCYTGKVQVAANGQAELLTPGQAADWQEAGWQRATFDASGEPLWQEGVFRYEAAPLSTVFAEIERQFDLQVEAPDSLLGRKYNGSFTRNSLDSALHRVCWPMGLEAERDGGVVRISLQ